MFNLELTSSLRVKLSVISLNLAYGRHKSFTLTGDNSKRIFFCNTKNKISFFQFVLYEQILNGSGLYYI